MNHSRSDPFRPRVPIASALLAAKADIPLKRAMHKDAVRHHPVSEPVCWLRRRRSAFGPERASGSGEMTVTLRELLTRVAGEPGRLLSGFINGIKRVRCSLLPAARQVLDRQGELLARASPAPESRWASEAAR
jgi:hypothetical protein